VGSRWCRSLKLNQDVVELHGVEPKVGTVSLFEVNGD
jgi:hypothetical protein